MTKAKLYPARVSDDESTPSELAVRVARAKIGPPHGSRDRPSLHIRSIWRRFRSALCGSPSRHWHRSGARFFDPKNGDLPDVVQIGFRRAPGFERLSHAEYAKLVREQVDRAVAKAAEERRQKGIQLVGRKAVLRQPWSHRPNTREPRRGISPRVACRNKWARIEALQRNKAFLDQYRGARSEHLAGRDAVFPPGTWWLCRYAGLTAAELGATAPPS